MSRHTFVFPILLLCMSMVAAAQKPFSEGTISYSVKLRSADQQEVSGVYTFTFKGEEIRKDLRLNNGYEDIVLINTATGKAYSLQSKAGKKYAIQLSVSDMARRQERYSGFVVKNEETSKKQYGGYATFSGNIVYKDGSSNQVYYTKDWRPAHPVTFERFPEAKFLPVYFTYTDENNITMGFEVQKIDPGPIENGLFRIPGDFQVIPYNEYKQFSK